MPAQKPLLKPSQKITKTRKHVSLSAYFPQGTIYFYGYPAGKDSGFLNRVAPHVEELVAARAHSCAGPDVSVVSFAATQAPSIEPDLLDRLAIPQLNPDQTILLPQEIDANTEGAGRNKLVKAALLELASPRSLVMAQPYTDSHMTGIYQIPPSLTNWFNDKNNMPHYIPSNLLAGRLATYTKGSELLQNYEQLALPYVIKVSLSSSGDGVHICRTKQDVLAAVDKLKDFSGTIFVESYIKAVKNYGVHFGIPKATGEPIDLLGINEQITSHDGEFLGGVVVTDTANLRLQHAIQRLRREILPAIRDKGWYGIGNFDVLTDEAGRLYFIDGNFRMTGMSAYHMLIANGTLQAPIVSFGGEFTGSRQEFEANLAPLAAKDSSHKIMHLIALSKNGRKWRFNGALHFSNTEQLHERVMSVLAHGVKSQALSQAMSLHSL
jgi:hypothetical protein